MFLDLCVMLQGWRRGINVPLTSAILGAPSSSTPKPKPGVLARTFLQVLSQSPVKRVSRNLPKLPDFVLT